MPIQCDIVQTQRGRDSAICNVDELESIALSEINQRQIQHNLTYMWNLKKGGKNTHRNREEGDFPSLAVQWLRLPCRAGLRVQPLVKEFRSHMTRGQKRRQSKKMKTQNRSKNSVKALQN